MNRVYKTVWSEKTGTFIAVSEHKKTRGKRSGSVKAAVVGAVLATGSLVMGDALAATGIDGGTGAGTAISECKGRDQANAGKKESIAIGCKAEADTKGKDTTFYNRENPYNKDVDTKEKYHSVAIGTDAKAKEASVAFGHGAQAAADKSALAIAIGSQAKAENVASLAIGPAALATGNTALALGRQTAATGDFAQAIGNVAAATGVGSLAVGHSATATGKRSIAIGAADIDNAASTGNQNGTVYMTGEQTLATGQDAIAFGAAANATSNYSLAIGAHSEASGLNSTAMGYKAEATGENTFASGASARASGKDAFALGANSVGQGDRSFAMGPNAQAIGENALALGSLSEAHQKNSIAVGVNAKANFADSVALGSNSSVDHENSIAIGTGSTTNDYTAHEAFLYESGAAGAIATGAVSIGNGSGSVAGGASNERRLQNVAAGGADTDAVNVSQLKKHKAITDKTGGDIANHLGGGAVFDPKDGAIKAPTYTVNNKTYNNVGDALKASNTTVKGGTNASVNKGINSETGAAIYTVNADNSTVSAGSDAVSVIASDKNAQNITDYKVDLSQETKDSLSNANKGWNYTADGKSKTNVAPGATVDFGNTDENIVITKGDDGLEFNLAKDIKGLDSITINNGPVISSNGINMGGKKITNLAAGEADTDAVNVSQLKEVSEVANKGLNFSANDGGLKNSKLGSTVTVAGAQGNADWLKFDEGQNIMTQIEQDADGNSVIRV
ncbi:ESPR-type extended signal peptide-containing protein, partial [Paenalcaligenes hermetiae]|uniref:ESPR-type extended signal peptide-containing protein n=2 Tax=Paenalcaligenes hermetiae TaxID=1157987 RepID=UPI0031E7CC6F